MNHKNLSFLLGLGLTFLACSCNDDSAELPDTQTGRAVQFRIGAISSRSTTNTDNSTEFVAGDRIGIYASKGATGTNVPFIVGSDGQLQAEADSGISSTSWRPPPLVLPQDRKLR